MKEISKILEMLSDIKHETPKWIEESFHSIKKLCPYRIFHKHTDFGDVFRCIGMAKFHACGYKICPYFLFKKEYLKQKGFIK